MLARLIAGGVGLSLLAVLGYATLFVLGAGRTLSSRTAVRSLGDELDEFLADVVGAAGSSAPLPPSSR